MAEVLLTVSGSVAPALEEQIASGSRPRADYLEMARAFDADLLDYTSARRISGHIGRALERLGGPNLLLAWACFRRRNAYRTIVTDGEQVGIPFALISKLFGIGRTRPRHLMIVHILSAKKKMLFFDYLGIQSHIDRFLVYSTWQKQFIEKRWKIAPRQVLFTPFMVDTRFFAPKRVAARPGPLPMICSVGLEARDYATLLAAVEGLDAQVTIAAASPWSKRADSTSGQAIPTNVSVRRFSQFELRQLYADSAFIVMPLHNVEFQAGVTAILEAMAMGRAVICSRTPGQTDVVVDGETGIYVPPGDARALRDAIEYLLKHPEIAKRMGLTGRRRVEQSMSLDCYVERLGQAVHEAELVPA